MKELSKKLKECNDKRKEINREHRKLLAEVKRQVIKMSIFTQVAKTQKYTVSQINISTKKACSSTVNPIDQCVYNGFQWYSNNACIFCNTFEHQPYVGTTKKDADKYDQDTIQNIKRVLKEDKVLSKLVKEKT
jgi:hypothetical protein